VGFLPTTTLDKTTILLSHPLRPRGHHGFQCPLFPAPYLLIITYSQYLPSSDNLALSSPEVISESLENLPFLRQKTHIPPNSYENTPTGCFHAGRVQAHLHRRFSGGEVQVHTDIMWTDLLSSSPFLTLEMPWLFQE
jgi:hypothetical protein